MVGGYLDLIILYATELKAYADVMDGEYAKDAMDEDVAEIVDAANMLEGILESRVDSDAIS